jgi:hypothetical protein
MAQHCPPDEQLTAVNLSSSVRYRAAMRKTTAKLALRKEALRALSTITLARIVGGQADGAPLAGDLTHEKVCNAAAAGDLTHENGCPAAMALKP